MRSVNVFPCRNNRFMQMIATRIFPLGRHPVTMPAEPLPGPDSGEEASRFNTTHWSVVLVAGDHQHPNSHQALALLCQTYWFPLYAHVRRRGNDAEKARDLTQSFFEDILARNAVGSADQARGRFRTFLLAAMDHFLHHTHRDAQALKRGGGREIVSWDMNDAEQKLALEPLDERSPDRDFDRRWALATLESARERLRNEMLATSKAELFDLLRPHLLSDAQGASYASIAERLNMTVVSVKVTMHRFRRRYGEILREEVAHTLANPADATEELRHLIESLA
jgi:RNA polymerase sigma factor (sigma-70 family)